MLHQNLECFLHGLTARSNLTSQEREAILALPMRTSQVQANHDIVRMGETSDQVCVVVAGIAGSFGETSEGARQITSLYIPGDAPDLHSVVLPKDRSSLQALSTTTVQRIPHSAVRAVAARFPALAEAFWRESAVDAGMKAQWVVNVGRRNAKTRVAHLLCEMAVRLKAPVRSGKVTFHLPLTQNHLADASGLTPVHVNRTLKALREAGLVAFERHTVTIGDLKGLEDVGEFDPAYLQMNLRPEERLRIAQLG